MLRFIAIGAAAIMFSSAANAGTYKRDVPANRSTVVESHAVYNKGTCYGGEIPQMKVTKKPEHGQVKIRRTAFKLSKDTGKCAGKSVKGVAVSYTPNKGFRGKDEFKLGFSFSKYEGSRQKTFASDKYLITVK